MCGEKSDMCEAYRACRGSPPRVRGEEAEKNEMPVAEGITPACAGRRTLSKEMVDRYEDHPRVCGEKVARPFTSQK